MTGIGFLGAGVIFKEGLSVRGLTTAASIWITAAIGIMIGVGFWFPAVVATVLVLGTLSVFRWIENRMPAQFYAQHVVRFARGRWSCERRRTRRSSAASCAGKSPHSTRRYRSAASARWRRYAASRWRARAS
jgi:uncharacterized membrane protein YhiD involved in acid resistance